MSSIHDRYRMENEAMRLGAVAYLRKPFDKQYGLGAINPLRESEMKSGKKRVSCPLIRGPVNRIAQRR